MKVNIKQSYRHLRHEISVKYNFFNNYFILRMFRAQIRAKSQKKRVIGVMLLEHLGDIVTCEPIARYLRKINPDSYIIWGVKKAYKELVETNPYVDSAISVHCLSERLMLINTGLFDEVIDLHFPDRFCSLCRKPLKKESESSKINLKNYFHHGSLLSAMSESAGLPALDEQPAVYIPESAVIKVDSLNLPERYIVINCTSNAVEKDWPADKWLQLLTKLKESIGLPVFEIGIKTVLDPFLSLSQSLCGKLSILESAEVIRRAKLFIGIDSGPAHLANAVGTAGVILIGNYLGFTKYNPFSGSYRKGDNAQIVYSDGPVKNLTLKDVYPSIEKMLLSNTDLSE